MDRSQGHRVDVAVIGGGPAAAAVALGLLAHDPEVSVATIFRPPTGARRRGETLHPGVRPLLEHLGAWEAFRCAGHVPAYGSRALWGGDEVIEHEFIYHRNREGWHLDRDRFDAALRKAAADRGAVLVEARGPVAVSRSSDAAWIVRSDAIGALAARVIVDATGRSAAVARRLGARKVRFDRLVGIFVTGRAGNPPPDTYTLVEAWEDGWWFSSVAPGGEMAVGCMVDAPAVRAFRLTDRSEWLRRARGSPHTWSRVEAMTDASEPTVHAAGSYRLDHQAGDGWLAIGDAAAAVDPLSSSGIFAAVHSGIRAGHVISDAMGGDRAAFGRYARTLEREFEAYLETRTRVYRREKRWTDRPFWRTRHAALTLDPHAVLKWDATRPDRDLDMHLPRSDLALMRSLAARPRSAAELAAGLTAGAAFRLSDRRAVLALQYLLAKGALTPATR